MAFLDIEKAYDCVGHSTLWNQLRHKGLPKEVVERLQGLYSGAEVMVEWQGRRSSPVPLERGLRQGCPLSPLLFMLLLCDLETDLETCGLGFDVSYMDGGKSVRQTLPGLMYADDVVLTAGTKSELQSLMDVCSRHADGLGLRFSARKCAVLRWGVTGVPNQNDPLTIQRQVIPYATSYQYLGVTIGTAAGYMEEHERKLKKKALRGQSILRCRALWAFNRMEVVRSLWKAVTVPGLTFANSVICLSNATREYMERRQREVGRMALGAHRATTNEAVQGDLGWSSFEAREAVAKLGFEIRSWALGGDRWVHRVQMCMLYTGATSQWNRRTRALATKYEVPLPTLNDLKGTSLGPKALRERVCAAETHVHHGSRELGASRHYGRTVCTRQRSAGRVSMTTVVGVPCCSRHALEL